MQDILNNLDTSFIGQLIIDSELEKIIYDLNDTITMLNDKNIVEFELTLYNVLSNKLHIELFSDNRILDIESVLNNFISANTLYNDDSYSLDYTSFKKDIITFYNDLLKIK